MLNVIFVLGSPGSGKGTICAQIAEKFNYAHISAGDCLRSEKGTPGSAVGEEIARCFREMRLVPVEIVCAVMEKAMMEKGGKNFVIDGFPRSKENVDGWERIMAKRAKVLFVIYLECPKEICVERCLARGRFDDDEAYLLKRFEIDEQESMPIVKYYQSKGQVRNVDATNSPDKVFKGVISMGLFEDMH